MLQNIFGDIGDVLRRHKCLVGIDAPHLVFPDALFLLHRLDVVDAAGQHILVIDGVDDGVAVEPVAKGLFRSLEMRQAIAAGILRENRSPGESEHVITLERLGDGLVHLIELRTMALIENQHHMRFEYRMLLVLGDEAAELLYGGDDDSAVRILQLALQDGGVGVGVGRTFFKAVVLLHGLVVQVLAVNHKQHLVYFRHLGGNLGSLEGSQRLAASGSVPDISSGRYGAEFLLIVGGNQNALEDLLRSGNLVRAHNQQLLLGCKYAESRQDIKQGVLGEEGGSKVHQIIDGIVLLICPERSELETAGCLLGVL